MNLSTELKTALSDLMELCFEKSVNGVQVTLSVYPKTNHIHVYHYDCDGEQTCLVWGESRYPDCNTITLDNIDAIKNHILEITND